MFCTCTTSPFPHYNSAVRLVPSEGVSEPLDLNTGNDEIVQGHPPCFLIILQQKILQAK